MIQFAFAAIGLIVAALVQTPDPVTTEIQPRQLMALEGRYAADAIARARREVCGDGPCNYVFDKPAEIAGRMCWNDAEAGQTYCRDAVAGTVVEACEAGPDGARYECWMVEMMEGAISEALADDPRLTSGELHWYSADRGGDAAYDIAASTYCAQPPQGACSRIYNIGVISREGENTFSFIFDHCWDDASSGLAQCRQAIIEVAY